MKKSKFTWEEQRKIDRYNDTIEAVKHNILPSDVLNTEDFKILTEEVKQIKEQHEE